MRAWSWIALAVLAGCGPSVPTFPVYGRDAGLECDEEDGELGPCPSGQVCLQGRCYARCTDTSCGPREECSATGVCVPRVSDGGMPDAPPPDPCDMVTCMTPTPVCRGGACYGCGLSDMTECGGPSPICDVARGSCSAFVGGVCAPCNGPADCAGGVPATCVTRTAPDPTERVCMPTCTDGVCPQGFTCSDMVCVPNLGSSCTGFRAAVDQRACSAEGTGDVECAPIGATATSGLFTGSCFDDGSGSPTCHHPCGVDMDCPAGQTCVPTGMPRAGFCI